MIAIRWADVGYPSEPGEREFAGITLRVEADHIAKWREDPDGIWEIENASSSASSRRYTLDRWHPSGTVTARQ
jgi:hypothetical protein